ncbi:MAG: hypothetical protein ABIU84_07825, partial [Thermoanaerobaculia bacterium]
QDGSGRGVFGQRFDASGAPAGVEFLVNSTTAGDQYVGDVAMAADGSFIVVWDSFSADYLESDVLGQRFSALGAKVGAEFPVNSTTVDYQKSGQIAVAPSGAFVGVWASVNQDGSGSGIFGQRFDANGVPAGAEFAVNSATEGDQAQPAIAVDGSGAFIASWNSRSEAGEKARILARLFDQDGEPTSGELEVSESVENDHGSSSLAVDGLGNFFVAWTAYLPNSIPTVDACSLAYGRRFDARGVPLQGEFRLNDTTCYTGGPQVVAGLPLAFATSWHSRGGWHNLAILDVYVKTFAVFFFGGDFEAGDVCAWSAAAGSGDSCP